MIFVLFKFVINELLYNKLDCGLYLSVKIVLEIEDGNKF